MLQIVGYIIGLGSFVLWIVILIQMFKTSVLHGILGIVTCGLWALIWGWMNRDKTGTGVMVGYTACIIASGVINFMVMQQAKSAMGDLQQKMEMQEPASATEEE